MQCPQCHKTCEPDSKFCRHCGTALPRDSALSDETDNARLSRLTDAIPDTLAHKMRAAHISGERKVVTFLFADVVDSTAIAAKIDAEVWTEIMNHVFEILSQAIYRHEGTIARLMGDSILAFFGAPVAHEDDPIRAIRAALDMVLDISVYAEELKGQHNIDLAIRAGINSGQVVVGDVGSDLKYEYTAMGDAINVASRLEQTAEPNQIVVSRSIYNATKMFFDFKPLKSVKVKGKEGKVERYLPVGLKEVFQELKGLGYGQLVGRDREMEIIKNLVGAIHESPSHLPYKGGLLEIKGEAGIGKSRLKYELRQLIKGREISFYQGYCPAYEVPIPYYPFSLILKEVLKLTDGGNEESQKQALADAVKGLGEDLVDTIPYLGAVLSLVYEEVAALDDKSRQEKIFSAMLKVFERLSHQKPIVLVFEDVQWIDILSKSLLAYLIEHSENLPILYCCLYRPEFEPSWSRADRVQILLGIISKEDEVRLIESLLGGLSLPQNLVDLILSKSEGNPFYLEEMIRSLMDQGILVKGRRGFKLKEEIGQIDIPDTIQGVIMSRLDRLERRSKETLQYASVIGREFPQRILEEISERGREVEEHLSLLQRLELIFQKQLLPELEYIFKHFLTREVAYNSILLKKRRELHLRIARAIEKVYRERLEEYYELLGYHYERAQSWLKAAEYFGKAGRKSEEIHSDEITKEHKEREEEAYGRLLFWFVLAAVVMGILIGISTLLSTLRFFSVFEPFISTLKQFEDYRRLSSLLNLFRVSWAIISNVFPIIRGSILIVVMTILILAFIKVFRPPWESTSIKIDWRHPLRIVHSLPRRTIFLIIMVGILMGTVLKYLALFLLEVISEKVAITLASMVFGALFWLVFSRGGILRTPKKLQVPPLGQAVWIGLHGAFAGGLICVLPILLSWNPSYVFVHGSTIKLESIVIRFVGTVLIFKVKSAAGLILEFIAIQIVGTVLMYCWVGLVTGTGLFVLARPDISLKKRLKASSLGWIIGLGGVVIGLMFYHLVMLGNHDRDLAQVIGIPKIASSNTTIVRFNGNKQLEVVQQPEVVKVSNPYYRIYTLDASEESVQKAMNYLQQRNYTPTSLSATCFDYIRLAQRLNWDFDSRAEWLYKVAKSDSSLAVDAITDFIFDQNRNAAKSPKWLKFLDNIAKDGKFYFFPSACKLMGQTYWKSSRRGDALYWYKRAGLSQKQLEEIESRPLPYTFDTGSLNGKILINDKAVPGIKVGILKLKKSTPDLISKPGNVDRKIKIIDKNIGTATETNSEGIFRFEHLIEGEYRLAIMADEKLLPSDAKKVKVINAPGRIIINEQNPTVDLGEIEIMVAK